MFGQGVGIFGDLRTVELTPVAGWTHAYNVNAELVEVTETASGTVTQENAMAVLSTGAAASSGAKIATLRSLRYIPGLGGLLRFTVVFSSPVAGSRQLIGLGTTENGFYLGFIDTDFVVVRLSGGVETVVTSGEFGSPFPADLDFTQGNVFQIAYEWLGFGKIQFSYEDRASGQFRLLHTIKYPNTAAVPSLVNPSMPVFAEVENTTNDTDIVMKTPSAMAFREGFVGEAVDPLALLRTFSVAATISTEAAVLSVRAKTTYQTLTNLIEVAPGVVSFAADGTKNVTISIYRGATLTGASWTDYSADTSSLESDTSATAFSGGALVFSYQLAKAGSLVDRIATWGLALAPGEILTITARSASSSDVNVTLLMEELF